MVIIMRGQYVHTSNTFVNDSARSGVPILVCELRIGCEEPAIGVISLLRFGVGKERSYVLRVMSLAI